MKDSYRLLAYLLLGAVICSCSSCTKGPTNTSSNTNGQTRIEQKGASLKISSTAFQDGGLIPSKYTCDGANVSPPLDWSGLPGNTKSLVLIVDDPDAPARTWVHWVVYGIPPSQLQLPEGVKPGPVLSSGGRQGVNDFEKTGYGGPCPPSGTHRYYFKLYALDADVSLKEGATKKDLEQFMEGHILTHAEIMGRYQRR